MVREGRQATAFEVLSYDICQHLVHAGFGEGELVQFIVLLLTALMAGVSLLTPPPPEAALEGYFPKRS